MLIENTEYGGETRVRVETLKHAASVGLTCYVACTYNTYMLCQN
jgi:hypothetical protein